MANVIEFTLRGYDKLSGAFSRVKNTFAKMFSVAKTAGLAIAGAAAAVVGFTAGMTKLQDSVARFSDRLGIATDELSRYQFVATQSGLSTQNFNLAIQRMTRRVAEASQGLGEAKGALSELNIDTQKFKNLSLDKQMEILADRIGEVETNSDRLRLAFKLFDSEGTAILQVLNKGSEAMKKMADDADFLGVVIGSQAAANAAKFQEAFGRATASIKGLGLAISDELAPLLTPLVNAFANTVANMRSNIVNFVTQAIRYFIAFRVVIGQVFDRLKIIFSGNVTALSNLLDNIGKFVIAGALLFAEFGRAIALSIFEGAKAAGEILTDFFTVLKEIIESKFDLLGQDIKPPDFSDVMAKSLVENIGPLTKKITDIYQKAFDNAKPIVEEGGKALQDAFGIDFTSALDKADVIIDRLRQLGTAAIEETQKANDVIIPFWDNVNKGYQQFLKDSLNMTEFVKKAAIDLTNSIGSGLGEAFSQVIFYGKDLTQQLQGFLKNVGAQVLTLLTQLGVKRIALSLTSRAATQVQASADAAKSIALAGAGGLASMAAAPFPINLGAPAFGAAMQAQAASLYTAGAAIGQGLGFSAVAHGGFTNVPKETTMLVDKGERIVSPRQNVDLTSAINKINSTDGNNGNVTIQNLKVSILENATSFDSLIEMSDANIQELVAEKIIPAFDKLANRGTVPLFVKRK